MTYSKTVAIFTAAPQFNVVESYYKLIPYETADKGYTLSIDKIVRVPQLTFEKLLDTMITQSANYDMFMIVDHGIENSLKKVWRLSMPLTANTTMHARDDVLEKLLHFMDTDASETDMTDFEKNHGLKNNGMKMAALPKGSVSRIVDKMKQLRKLKVRWVSIRACALGTNPAFMETLGRCFSALFINAPDVHMFYSQPMKPVKPASQASYDAFVKARPDSRTFNDGNGTELALQVQGTGPLRNIKGISETIDLTWFMKQNFDKGNRYFAGKAFQIAGMDTLGANKYALPLEPGYYQHLIWSKPLPGNLI